MRLRIFIITLIFSFFAMTFLHGSPARRGQMMLMQPDGTSFTAFFKGDEFTRIKTTREGYAIIQDKDGWWCYATYDSQGCKTCSGWKVGRDAPADILADSRNIPHKALSERALEIRLRTSGTGHPQMKRAETGKDTKAPVMTRHGIVILAEFQDIRFEHSKEEFEAMLTQPGYNRHGATGSAKEYFEEQFEGVIGFDFMVSEIVTLGNKRAYYGGNDNSGNDTRPDELITEACRLADRTVDFSTCDDDGDGVVDNVFVFFAGDDEAEGGDEDCIWSHTWNLSSGTQKELDLDGCRIDRYACASEMTRIYSEAGKLKDRRLSGIGTFCHEYSHTFGLPDMYDTDYDNYGGWAAGLWCSTSIMDAGNQNNHGNTPPNYNAIERHLLGISDPIRIRRTGEYSMSPINVKGEYFLMETDDEDEYYLFECRNSGQKWDAYIGGSGMLVYHVDRRKEVIDRWNIHNTVNSDASHQCADLVEADGREDSFSGPDDYLTRKGNSVGLFFPYNGINMLEPSGTPGLNFWSGEEGMLSVSGIQLDEEGVISFSITGESEETAPPSVRSNIEHDVFCDGAIVKFRSSREHEGSATVSYGLTGEAAETVMVEPYEPGRYAMLIDDLEPSGNYTVTIKFVVDGAEGKSRSISFTTRKEPSVSWPYMDFGNARRNDNGTFLYDSRIPLKVINARDVEQITWTFDDEEIKTEDDYYYTLGHSGTLKAHIIQKDGSEHVVVKEITLAPFTAQ